MADWANHFGASLRRPLRHDWVRPGNAVTRVIEADLDLSGAAERVPLQARLPLPEFQPAPPAAVARALPPPEEPATSPQPGLDDDAGHPSAAA